MTFSFSSTSCLLKLPNTFQKRFRVYHRKGRQHSNKQFTFGLSYTVQVMLVQVKNIIKGILWQLRPSLKSRYFRVIQFSKHKTLGRTSWLHIRYLVNFNCRQPFSLLLSFFDLFFRDKQLLNATVGSIWQNSLEQTMKKIFSKYQLPIIKPICQVRTLRLFFFFDTEPF